MVLLSALPPLVPELITNKLTGEVLDMDHLNNSLGQLANYVQTETQRLWVVNKQHLTSIKVKSPAEAGRQAGIKPDLSALGREVKAKSRIERLVRYNLITGARSYLESEVTTKQEPSFPLLLNLGAVDAQLAGLTLDGKELTLSLKCWDTEYALLFTVPSYVVARALTKACLPVIRKQGNGWVFSFTVGEAVNPYASVGGLVAGVDLGRVEPYTLVIVHEATRSIVAEYTASPRLRVLCAKRDRLYEELGYMSKKSRSHGDLGIVYPRLEAERVLTRAKRNRLLNSITWQIATEVNAYLLRHKPERTSVENLGFTTKYGTSRWTHSKDQSAITHKNNRSGITTKRVSARDTSQVCHKCGNGITHVRGKRTVTCTQCKTQRDRDVSAGACVALDINGRNKTQFPLCKRNKGSKYRGNAQLTVPQVPTQNVLISHPTSPRQV